MKQNNSPRFLISYIENFEPGDYFKLLYFCHHCVFTYTVINGDTYYAYALQECLNHYNFTPNINGQHKPRAFVIKETEPLVKLTKPNS